MNITETKKYKYFINLTTGIEAFQDLPLVVDEVSFIRIQSSHIERSAFDDLLYILDDNLLIHLALGYTCVIIDYGARSNTSKVTRIGLEWIRFYLNRVWFNKFSDAFINNMNITERFTDISFTIEPKTRKRISYFRKFLKTDKLKLIGLSKATFNDGKNKYFETIMKELV